MTWQLRTQHLARRTLLGLQRPLCGLPDCLLIGAQKAGTTTLFAHMVSNPQVARPLMKEPHFFELPDELRRGVDWYATNFPARPGRIRVDASTQMASVRAQTLAPQLLPDARLICVLRDPVERIVSHYRHNVHRGRETRSFAEALAEEPALVSAEERRLAEDVLYDDYLLRTYGYVYRSRYGLHLERWLRSYPRERVLVLTTDELQEPTRALNRVEQFLGLPQSHLVAPIVLNAASPGGDRILDEVRCSARRVLAKDGALVLRLMPELADTGWYE